MPDETTGTVYFTAAEGTVYRVLDTAWKDGRIVAGNPPTEWATTRVFRAKSGERRFYPLAYLELHAETREPRLDWLARQFARSEASGPRPARTLAAKLSPPKTDAH